MFNFLNRCFSQEDYFVIWCLLMSTETSAPWNMLRNRILILKNYLFPLVFSISPQIFMKENFYTFSTKAKCSCLLWTEDWATFSITVTLRDPVKTSNIEQEVQPWTCNFLRLRCWSLVKTQILSHYQLQVVLYSLHKPRSRLLTDLICKKRKACWV